MARLGGRVGLPEKTMRPVPLGPDGEELPDGHRCPDCGGPIERLHRNRLDRWASLFRSLHRYHCMDAACGWEGLVGRLEQAPPAAQRPSPWRTRLLWLVAGAGLAGAAVLGIRQWKQPSGPARAVQAASAASAAGAAALARLAAPGEDVEGPELPAADARVRANATPLTLRRHCAWGTPGANRYRGTVAQALSAARLPPEVVRQVAAMADRGELHGQVRISRDAVSTLDGQRKFSPRLRAMGFGNTLCFATRVNFPAGHVEHAALYEVRDDRGHLHTVMVPYVCNNVAVLGEEADEEDDEGGKGAAGPQDVPEPPAWALALGALGALGLLAWQRRRK